MEKNDFNAYREKLILNRLSAPKTANEVISEIFENDLIEGKTIKERGWKFYVHLSKFFSPMKRKGLIANKGMRKKEKLWVKK